jgi:hypothetical protein
VLACSAVYDPESETQSRSSPGRVILGMHRLGLGSSDVYNSGSFHTETMISTGRTAIRLSESDPQTLTFQSD